MWFAIIAKSTRIGIIVNKEVARLQQNESFFWKLNYAGYESSNPTILSTKKKNWFL